MQVYIFTTRKISDEHLTAALRDNPQFPSFVEVIRTLIDYADTDQVRVATQRALDLYNIGEHKLNTLSELYQLADEEENPAVAGILLQRYLEHAPYAPVPPWMIFSDLKLETELSPPVVAEPTVQLPETLEAQIELLLPGFRALGLKEEEITEAATRLETELAGTTREEQLQLLAPYLLSTTNAYLADNPELFRYFSACNAKYSMVLDNRSDFICSRYGGCRLLTCVCFEGDPEDDDDDPAHREWFLGYCEQCYLRIRRRYHAVRKPRPHGGWEGCFCSLQCIRDSVSEPQPWLEPLLTALEEQLIRYGVQDRLPVSNSELPLGTNDRYLALDEGNVEE